MSDLRVGARGEQKRRWDREKGRGECPCGARPSKHRNLCVVCLRAARREARETRRSEIQRGWNDDLTIREIAARLDSTPGSIGVELTRMRADGWVLPYRTQRVAP